MYRQLVPRSTRPSIYLPITRLPITSREFATTPPPSSQEHPGTSQTPSGNPQGSNTLIILSALGALGGLYYYYALGQPGVEREIARDREEETEKKVRKIGDAVAKQGEREYNEIKDAATATRTDVVDWARQGAHDAQAKLDGLKNTAEEKIGNIRDRVEKRVEEGKEEAVRQGREAENKARSWFGWGSSK